MFRRLFGRRPSQQSGNFQTPVSSHRVEPFEIPKLDVRDAQSWLNETNRYAFDNWAHGHAVRWSGEQKGGTLTAHLPEGRKITFPLKFIGTWNRRESSYLWADMNMTVKPDNQFDLSAMRDSHPDCFPERGTVDMKFDPASEWATEAAFLGGAKGVFHGIDDNTNTGFYALGDPLEECQNVGQPVSENESAEAMAFIEDYFARQVVFDTAYYDAKDTMDKDDAHLEALQRDLLKQRIDLYKENATDYTDNDLPAYFSKGSDFDMSKYSFVHLGPHPDDGLQLVLRSTSWKDHVRIKRVGKEFKLAPKNYDFARIGVLWPTESDVSPDQT